MRKILFILVLININTLFAQNQKIVLEVFETTWCDACPAAAMEVEQVLSVHPDVIPVALHFGPDEPMNVDAAFQLAGTFTGASAPAAMINRTLLTGESYVALEVDAANLNNRISQLKATAPKASVALNNASYNETTRQLSVDVDVEFLQAISGLLLNFNLFIVEDQIQNSDPSYAQASPSGLISDYTHRYVLRAMLGEEWGDIGIVNVPAVNPGDAFSTSYTYTVPAAWDASKIKIVGIMQQQPTALGYDNRPILNADMLNLSSLITTPVGIEDATILSEIKVYPNPFNEYVEIDFNAKENSDYQLVIYDILGNQIYSKDVYLNAGWHNLFWDGNSSSGQTTSSGLYFVQIMREGQVLNSVMLNRL